jgi:NitT/TauT family transport system permease protein
VSIREADQIIPVTRGEAEPGVREGRSVVRPARWKKYEALATGMASVVGFLLLWQFTLRETLDLGLIHLEPPPKLFVPRPTDVAEALVKLFQDPSGAIWVDISTSAQEVAVGYGGAIVVGLVLGLLMGWYMRFQYALDPFVNFFYSTPRIVLVPLFILWFGIDWQSKVAVIFLGALFPIIINTMAGVRNTEAALLRVAKSFGASDALIFRRVVLPGSVPFILTGFRLGVGHALTGVIVGELIAARHGVGQLIAISGQTFQTPKMFAGVILIAGSGMLLTTVLQRIENRFQSWRPQIRR